MRSVAPAGGASGGCCGAGWGITARVRVLSCLHGGCYVVVTHVTPLPQTARAPHSRHNHAEQVLVKCRNFCSDYLISLVYVINLVIDKLQVG